MNILDTKEKYDNLFKKSKFNFLQSFGWGEVKKPVWTPKRFELHNNPVTIFMRKIPILNQYFGYIPRAFDESSLSKERLKELKNLCERKLNLTHLILELNIFEQLGKDEKIQKIKSVFLDLGFKKTGRTIQPNYTNIIDLTQSWGEIFSKFKSTYRRNVRKAKKLGCVSEVHTQGQEIVKRFYKIMESIMKRTKYVMHGFDYFDKIWKELGKEGMAKIYIITKNNEDLGALFVVFDEKGAYELYGGINNAGKSNRAGFLLREVTFKDAKNMKKEFYDQWGVAAFSKDGYSEKSELIGVSRFKSGFGGQDKKFFEQYTYVYNFFGYFVYKIGKLVNKIKIKIKKIIK